MFGLAVTLDAIGISVSVVLTACATCTMGPSAIVSENDSCDTAAKGVYSLSLHGGYPVVAEANGASLGQNWQCWTDHPPRMVTRYSGTWGTGMSPGFIVVRPLPTFGVSRSHAIIPVTLVGSP